MSGDEIPPHGSSIIERVLRQVWIQFGTLVTHDLVTPSQVETFRDGDMWTVNLNFLNPF